MSPAEVHPGPLSATRGGAPDNPCPQPGAVGVVVIGRNEGARLRLCLESVLRSGAGVVYADSGSDDGSVELARGLGAGVVELDPGSPFTAARGRNEGFARITERGPLELIQFVDGDCELAPGWLGAAGEALRRDPGLALVCGRLREKHRDRSAYARLCDMEWGGPVGPITSCGGIFMIRAEAFRAVNGFLVGHVAGEEPDLCARLMQAGWRLERIGAEMATHDADMTRFGQWWRRATRAGWAYAKAASRGNAERSGGSVRRVATTLMWALGLPLAAGGAMLLTPWPVGLAVCGLVPAAYAALFFRVRGHRIRGGDSGPDAGLYAAFCVLSKWPESLGFFRYWLGR